MFYNLLHYPSTQPSRISHLEAILDDYQPDIFAVCELENGGASGVLNAIQTPDNRYVAATFVSNQSVPSSDLQQMIYFNHQKLNLVTETVHTTVVRDINQYTFLLETPDKVTNPKYLEVFVTHLKAGTNSQNPNNEQKRLDAINVFTTALNSVPTDRYILFAGDFNLYDANEPAYVELLDPTNNIVMVDPINRPGSWHNTSSFQDIFTQSTFSVTDGNGHIGDGSTGGIDDRFDFIMMSENLQTSSEVYYKPNTYAAYGNNGNCWNKSINNTSCSGTYSQTIRNHLFNFSDHLPVVMELETQQTLTISSEIVVENLLSFSDGNIVTHSLGIKKSPNKLNNSTLIIYNQLGQRVLDYYITREALITLDVAHLSTGIYYITNDKFNIEPLKFFKTN
ncbi:endonuclease/exonuclease/phosphatase family protein [Pseudofulvibacter geojedonensis]